MKPPQRFSPDDWKQMSGEARQTNARLCAGEVNVHDLLSLTTAYMDQLGMSGGAQNNHRSRIKHALHYLRRNKLALLEPDFDLGTNYISALCVEGRAFNTVRSHTSSLRILYEALAWCRLIRHDPYFAINVCEIVEGQID